MTKAMLWTLWQSVGPASSSQNRRFGTALALDDRWLGVTVPGAGTAQMFTFSGSPYEIGPALNSATMRWTIRCSYPASPVPLADPDKDRIPNMLEAWAGLNPAAADGSILKNLTVYGGEAKLRIHKGVRAHGVAARLEYSTDLKTWSGLPLDPISDPLFHRSIEENEKSSLLEVTLHQPDGKTITGRRATGVSAAGCRGSEGTDEVYISFTSRPCAWTTVGYARHSRHRRRLLHPHWSAGCTFMRRL